MIVLLIESLVNRLHMSHVAKDARITKPFPIGFRHSTSLHRDTGQLLWSVPGECLSARRRHADLAALVSASQGSALVRRVRSQMRFQCQEGWAEVEPLDGRPIQAWNRTKLGSAGWWAFWRGDRWCITCERGDPHLIQHLVATHPARGPLHHRGLDLEPESACTRPIQPNCEAFRGLD